PPSAADVEQQCPRCVGRVSDVIAAIRKARHQPAVHSAQRRVARAFDMLHRPARFRGREVRVEHQSRDLAHLVVVARLAQPYALFGGAPVLPPSSASTTPRSVTLPGYAGLPGAVEASCRVALEVERNELVTRVL